jgi:hypothetical protein
VSAAFRIFVDSNVLFSASYRAAHPFVIFWTSEKAHPIVSSYVVRETGRNATGLGHQYRLNDMLRRTEIVDDPGEATLSDISLPEKDRPILSGALVGRARYLATGDKNHFGDHFDRTFAAPYGPLTIIQPGVLREYLKSLE